MADDGFDFHTPERREAKQFEPPPWEREAFEELERKRADQEVGQRPPVDQAAAGATQAPPDAPEREVERGPVSEAAVGQGVAAGRAAQPGSEDAPVGPTLDEARVTEMLAGLSAEEPRSAEGLWRAAIGSAIVLGAIGVVLVVWAIAAIVSARRSGAVGLTGGLILLFFGAGFVAGALWLTVRTLRQQGVL